MSEVFISYNRASASITKGLASDIEALGHVVWLDQELSGGQAWWDKILARIRSCDLFVFVLDQKALDSTACRREFGYAARLGKTVLPVLVADGISTNLLPVELSRIQFIDYRTQDRTSALALARAIASVPPAPPLPDPLPAAPEVPISYLGTLTSKVETATSLSYEAQAALVLDLQRSLRDPEVAADTRLLLEKLRARRDLYAAIADDVDALIGSRTRTPVDPPRSPAHDAKPKPSAPREAQREPPPRADPGPPALGAASSAASVGRWRTAVLAATVGVFSGYVMALISPYSRDAISVAMVMGGGLALAGGITGNRRNRIRIAGACAVLALLLSIALDSGRDGILNGTFLGIPGGAVFGAIIGEVWNRKRATNA